MFQLLRRVLVAEINALQGMAAIGQRPLLMEVNASLLFQGKRYKKSFLVLIVLSWSLFISGSELSPAAGGGEEPRTA